MRIGLLGGMSWQSSAEYYRALNEQVQKCLGGLHSARLLLDSVDFGEMEALQRSADWDRIGKQLALRAQALQGAGAGCIGICSNTTHRVADTVAAGLKIPVVHIVDSVTTELARIGARRPILLATDFTVQCRVYEGVLGRHAIEVLHLDRADQAWLHEVIYNELCHGRFSPRSRERLQNIIGSAAGRGADAAILGCTELGLLLGQEPTAMPTIDTTQAHVSALLELALRPAKSEYQ